MIWNACVSTEQVQTNLVEFIKCWFGLDNNNVTKYAGRLPTNARIQIVKPGEKFSSGIRVLVMVGKGGAVNPYNDINGRTVLSEQHHVTIAVQADTRAGKAAATTAVIAVLKSLFGSRGGSDERNDLVTRGIYELDESVDGLQFSPTDPDNEGDWYTQVMNLSCRTETYSN